MIVRLLKEERGVWEIQTNKTQVYLAFEPQLSSQTSKPHPLFSLSFPRWFLLEQFRRLRRSCKPPNLPSLTGMDLQMTFQRLQKLNMNTVELSEDLKLLSFLAILHAWVLKTGVHQLFKVHSTWLSLPRDLEVVAGLEKIENSLDLRKVKEKLDR